MYGLTLNPDLLKLIEGKRVAIVGPAPHLVGKGDGKLIDDYDIVCRVNRHCVPVEHRDDYGHRTDILFHNLGAKYLSKLEDEIAQFPKEWDGLKMGCCMSTKCLGRERIHKMSPNWVSPVVEHWSRINNNNIPFYWIGVPDYHKLWHACDRIEPNQGMLSMTVLAHYPLKELYVTGFTYYDGSTIDECYYSGYAGGRVGGHGGQEEQKRTFKYCYDKSRGMVKVDERLGKVLGI